MTVMTSNVWLTPKELGALANALDALNVMKREFSDINWISVDLWPAFTVSDVNGDPIGTFDLSDDQVDSKYVFYPKEIM